MIPTFIGSTILVFTILQMAPGGPIEQMMLELQMGGAMAGEAGGGSSSSHSGAVSLPPKALQELKRFYGFDKPIYERYLSWLGIWPREIKHRDLNLPKDINSIEKRVGKIDGKLWKIDIALSENKSPIVYEKSGEVSNQWFSKIENFNPGTAIVFPSFINHKVEKITSGSRASLAIWMNGPKFR